MCHKYKVQIADESIVIASLLHDLCKIGYTDKGHAAQSIIYAKQYIELNQIEEDLIRYHMGIYGLTELGFKDYNITELYEAYRNPVLKLFYFCDEICSQFIEETRR
jgi:HD superfamily phosphohydrolase YqeK